jgi:hypothetical protein
MDTDDWFNKCSLGNLGENNVHSVAMYVWYTTYVKGGYDKFLADALFATPRLTLCEVRLKKSFDWIATFIDPVVPSSGGVCKEPDYTG